MGDLDDATRRELESAVIEIAAVDPSVLECDIDNPDVQFSVQVARAVIRGETFTIYVGPDGAEDQVTLSPLESGEYAVAALPEQGLTDIAAHMVASILECSDALRWKMQGINGN